MHNNVEIQKINNSSGAVAEGGAVCLLIANGCTAFSGADANKDAYRIYNLAAAEKLGITEQYDEDNTLLLHYHIKQFFESKGDDAILYLKTIDGDGDMRFKTDWFKSVKATIKRLKVEILAVYASNVNEDTVAEDIKKLPAALQEMQDKIVNELASRNYFLDAIIVDCGNGGHDVVYPSILEITARNVTPIVFTQPIKSAANGKKYNGYSDFMIFVSHLTARQVHESAASVQLEKKPKGFEADKYYPIKVDSVGIAGKCLDEGNELNQYFGGLDEDEVKEFKTKGYIIADDYATLEGYFFNKDSTAVALNDDFNRILKNRTWNKAARIVLKELESLSETTFYSKDGGRLTDAEVSLLKIDIKEEIKNQMIKKGNLSGFDIELPNILNVRAGEELVVIMSLENKGIFSRMVGKIGFTTK